MAYETPKTNWALLDTVAPEDMNRIGRILLEIIRGVGNEDITLGTLKADISALNEMFDTWYIAEFDPFLTDTRRTLDSAGQANGLATLDANGKVPMANLPVTEVQDATTSRKGIVQLSNAINLDDATKAATSKALNELRKIVATYKVDILGGDPNTPDRQLMLTSHANGPVTNVYFYIETVEYDQGGNYNYFQTAKGYNRNVVYTRFKYWESSTWSAWALQYNAVTVTASNVAPPTNLFEGYQHQVYS